VVVGVRAVAAIEFVERGVDHGARTRGVRGFLGDDDFHVGRLGENEAPLSPTMGEIKGEKCFVR
jgi:hypothetical protein